MRDIAISVKASDVARTLAAYRLLAERTDCPLHLGVTEAGTFLPGTVRSSVALGILLEEGLGDTIRVSLTDAPEREVKVGLEILRVDVVGVAAAVEEALERLVRTDAARGRKLPRVAVMGCVVNGPGEAKGADVALCGGAREFLLYVGGRPAGKVRPEDAVAAVLSAVRGLMSEEAKG